MNHDMEKTEDSWWPDFTPQYHSFEDFPHESKWLMVAHEDHIEIKASNRTYYLGSAWSPIITLLDLAQLSNLWSAIYGNDPRQNKAVIFMNKLRQDFLLALEDMEGLKRPPPNAWMPILMHRWLCRFTSQVPNDPEARLNKKDVLNNIYLESTSFFSYGDSYFMTRVFIANPLIDFFSWSVKNSDGLLESMSDIAKDILKNSIAPPDSKRWLANLQYQFMTNGMNCALKSFEGEDYLK
jgi:hypothetical protein